MEEKVFAIAMVKNEDDIILPILNYFLTQDIDHFIIADNLSNDNTRPILDDFAAKYPQQFTIIEDDDPAYYQAIKMNRLSAMAAEKGASIILPFDADECWVSTDKTKTVGQALRTMEEDVAIATVWDFVPQPTDLATGSPIVDINHREPVVKALPSVAFKYEAGAELAMGNHSVTHSGRTSYDTLVVRHYQYRSLSQYIAKLRNGKRAYDATTYPEGTGYHWRHYGSLSDDALYDQWVRYTTQPGLIYDPLF